MIEFRIKSYHKHFKVSLVLKERLKMALIYEKLAYMIFN